MSLSVPHVQLGNWGTLGYFGQQRKLDFPYSVFACFFLQIHATEFREHVALVVADQAHKEFHNCVLLGPTGENVWGVLFAWELGSMVRDANKLLLAAAKRFRNAEETGVENSWLTITSLTRNYVPTI